MSIAVDQLSTRGFDALDRLCVKKLQPVSFGSYNSADHIVTGIDHAHQKGLAISEKQRMTLYRICWRFRKQIGDWSFIAQVLIATALLEELLDVERRELERPKVRGWRAAEKASPQLFSTGN